MSAIAVFVACFVLVTGIGFAAARWRRGDLSTLDEWGLAGRRFGVAVSWFLIGGDFYTAYTVIAVPGAVFGTGAAGFFALPYTILVYPIVFVLMPRLWTVCQRNGYVTPADFVHGRYGSKTLALAIAATGILATLPYIALQLVGMQVVIAALGFSATGLWADAPLLIAFVILAAYTYTSGLRAPAMIAFVKDLMIYAVVIAIVAIVPARLGGFGAIFTAAANRFAHEPASHAGHVILPASGAWPYATLALGSALAAFMYPHTVTSVLSASKADVVRRNAVLLPLYTFVLGILALLGYMALAANVHVASPTEAVPALMRAMFPPWFVGFAFAAIAIGALVPAAIMSIAAANLWTRNVYVPYLRPNASPADEATMAKRASLVVKLGALAFVVAFARRYAIDLQLLGGIWILQTFPAIALGLHRRFFHHAALLWGWAAGMIVGTSLSLYAGMKPTLAMHLGGARIEPYIGLDALAINLAVTIALTAAFDRRGVARLPDATATA